jgi:segregation and condensation protein B
MSLKAKIEAVLFLTSKPIKAQAIARIVNADVQNVRQALLELVHDYEERKGGLEIDDNDGYSFQVRDEFSSLMDEFLPIEMSAALIRTLSAIAIKQPVMQSEIIRVRGAGAYEHIKELVAKDLISKKDEQGERSPMLATTKKFQEYFKLSKDGKDLRNFLKRQVRKADAAAAASAAAEVAGLDDDKQLAISDVVTAKTDEFINAGIYLETADGTPDEISVNEITAAEAIPSAAEEEDFAAPAEMPAIAAEVPEEVLPVVSEPAPVTTPVEAASMLGKLADVAAEAKEPEAANIEDVDVAPTQSTSSVQANNAKRKEPKMAKTPPAAKKAPAKKEPPSLFDLLMKQKTLEKQLKIGNLETSDESIVPPPQVESDLPLSE